MSAAPTVSGIDGNSHAPFKTREDLRRYIEQRRAADAGQVAQRVEHLSSSTTRSRDHDGDGILKYAQKIRSSPGKHDGLYGDGEPENLVPKAFADAAAAMFAEGKHPVPYHGYYFRILKAQGPDAQGGTLSYVVKGKTFCGFALVAYPADYGVFGLKTFLVNHHGIVYEKDLGPTTATLARQMKSFNPDKTWRAVEGE